MPRVRVNVHYYIDIDTSGSQVQRLQQRQQHYQYDDYQSHGDALPALLPVPPSSTVPSCSPSPPTTASPPRDQHLARALESQQQQHRPRHHFVSSSMRTQVQQQQQMQQQQHHHQHHHQQQQQPQQQQQRRYQRLLDGSSSSASRTHHGNTEFSRSYDEDHMLLSSLPHRAPANVYDDDDDEVNEEDGLGSACEEPVVSCGIDDGDDEEDDRDSTISEDDDDALDVKKNIGILTGANEDSTDKLFAADNDDDDDDDDVEETRHVSANTPSDTVLSTDDEDDEVEEEEHPTSIAAQSRRLARNLTPANVASDAAMLRFGEEVFVEEEEELILFGDGTGAQRHCRHHERRQQSRHIDGAEQCIHVVHEEHRHCGDAETPSLPSSRGRAGSELLAWRTHHHRLGRDGPPSDSETADESVADTATPTPIDMGGVSETRLRRRLHDIEGHVQHALGLMSEATSATSYFHPRHSSLEREHPGSRPESTSDASLVNYDAVARRRTATAASCHRRRSSTTTTHVSRIVQPQASSGTVAHYRRRQRQQQHDGAGVADVSDLHRHSHTAALDVFDCDDETASVSAAIRRQSATAGTRNESGANCQHASSSPPHAFDTEDVETDALHSGCNQNNGYDDIDDVDDSAHNGPSHSSSSASRDRQQQQQQQEQEYQHQQQWRTSVSPVVDYRHIRYTYSSIVEGGRAAGSGTPAVGVGEGQREGAETASPPAEYYPADWSHPRELDDFLREFQQSMELAEYEPSLAHVSEHATGMITPPLPYQLPLDALSTVTTADHDADSFERYMAATEALHRYNQNHYEITTNESVRHRSQHDQQHERHQQQRRFGYDTRQPHRHENTDEANRVDASEDAVDQEPAATIMSPPESFFTPRVQGVHGWTWINKQQQQLNQKYKEQLEQQEQQQLHNRSAGDSAPNEKKSEAKSEPVSEEQQSNPTASSPKSTEKTEEGKSPASSLMSPPTRCYFAFRGPVVPRNRVNVNLFPLQQQQQQQQQYDFQPPDCTDETARSALPSLTRRGTTPIGLLSGSLAAAATATTSSHTQQVSTAASGSGIEELLKRVRTPLSKSKAYGGGGDDSGGSVRRRSTTTLSPKKHAHHHHHRRHPHRSAAVPRSGGASVASSSSAMNAMMNHSMTLERRSRA